MIALPRGLSLLLLSALTAACCTTAGGQLINYDGFAAYPVATQLEPGAAGSSGIAPNGGAGWPGPFNVNNAIKTLVKVENRAASPVVYQNGALRLHGGGQALRFYDNTNGSSVLIRPLGRTFTRSAGDDLWFSLLFRSSNASPLANQDFVQIGFDNSAAASNPRLSFGANTVATTFPPSQDFRFFVRATTDTANSVFDSTGIAAATTYLLTGRLSGSGATYDTIELFLNPDSLSVPAQASASLTLDSGMDSLTHFIVRTSALDSGDAYVFDEFRIGLDYLSVVQPPPLSLDWAPAAAPVLRWPASLPAVLETGESMTSGAWTAVAGPFAVEGMDYVWPVPSGPLRAFFRLRQP